MAGSEKTTNFTSGMNMTAGDDTVETKSRGRSWRDVDLRAVAPFAALALLLIVGALVNPNFIGINNLANVATRSAFIAIIAVSIAHTFNYDRDFFIPAETVTATEDARTKLLAERT